MKQQSVFISYNSGSEIEQILALRLHTIGSVNGLNMYVPDRRIKDFAQDTETKLRISLSDWFIVFLLGSQVENNVIEEINYFIKIKQHPEKVMLVYNPVLGKRLKGKVTDKFEGIPFDPKTDSWENVNSRIIESVKKHGSKDDGLNSIIALVGIGLGLMALNSFSDEGKKKGRKKK